MTGNVLGLGKVSQEVLRRTVLEDFPMEGAPGLDGGAFTLKGETLVSHSPSIGVPLESVGFFAFHYAASNVAERFAKPRHMVVGIYLPLRSTEEELKTITKNLGDEAKRYGVTAVAGQTATYYGLELPLITVTCLGEPAGKSTSLTPGDVIMVIGRVGAEACWLDSIARGEESTLWRQFTPLPAIFALQKTPGVKLMHDVSEGGVKRALREVAEAGGIKLSIDSVRIPLHEGVASLGQDPLRAPTFGTFVVAVAPEAVNDIHRVCKEIGAISSTAGVVEEGSGVYIDGEFVGELDRMAIDWVYGSFADQDETVTDLRNVISQLEKMEGFNLLIPQVGSNMVYAKQDARSPGDVAALTGRLINMAGKPHACGKVALGGSKYTSSIILEAIILDPLIRSAVSIRGGVDLVEALMSIGVNMKELESVSTGDICPVTVDIAESGKLYGAYHHPGAFGVEPTITVLAETPSKLLDTLKEAVKIVQDR